MKIKKPTDDELRKQIKGSIKHNKFLRYFGLIAGIICVIFVNSILGFMIAVSGFIMANQHMLSSKQDKIRLEIRETNRKHFKNNKQPYRKHT